MKHLFQYLAILNLLAAFLTYYGLLNSHITEANPLMNSLYETHPFLFMTVKLTLSFLLYVLSLYIKPRPAYWIKGISIADWPSIRSYACSTVIGWSSLYKFAPFPYIE
ncbi:DUF5658 family protein [Bacillus sp. V5-8f]|uniref:DUF5658 family protein n=1 Tax=Bacillus sp. V5-8f TaxID=2053044 RepID=UPI000C76E833|nr:DUF5658 family protein [Bacillus sp. V5-8f]PLT32894.1 hypothetical protein CUU64_15750 [Bacillus sp. V5-8f]